MANQKPVTKLRITIIFVIIARKEADDPSNLTKLTKQTDQTTLHFTINIVTKNSRKKTETMAITNSTLNRQSSFSSVGTESTTSSSSCSSHHHGVVERKQSSMKRRSTSSNHDDGNDDDDISSRKISFMISQLTTKEIELVATRATNHGGTSLLSFEKKRS